MNPVPSTKFDSLPRYEKACARLAWIAVFDTVNGTAHAMSLSRRCTCKQFPASSIVSDVYSRSTGKCDPVWGAWECRGCGTVHLGKLNAAMCCGN